MIRTPRRMRDLSQAAHEFVRLAKIKFPLCEHQNIQYPELKVRLYWLFGWRVSARTNPLPCTCEEFMEASR